MSRGGGSVNVIIGIAATALLHGSVVAMVGIRATGCSDSKASVGTKLKEIIAARLVRLGKPRSKKLLPRIPTYTPPPLEQGAGVSEKVRADSTPVKKKTKIRRKRKWRPRSRESLEERLRKRIESIRNGLRPGKNQEQEGSPDGSPDGEAGVGGRIAGNIYAGKIRRHLYREWIIPKTISERQLMRLEAVILLRLTRSGAIATWKFKSRSGNSWFDDSIASVFHRVKRLPAPSSMAWKMFPRGWLALKFKKE